MMTKALNTFSIKDVKIVNIGSVKLWKNNPRHNDKNITKLMEIIKTHGQRTPIVVWRKNNVIYKGNSTCKAMRKLGFKTIAVIFADFKSVVAATAYGISDNKASEWSAWDDDLLSKLLDDKGIFDGSGFTTDEIVLKDSKMVDKINAKKDTDLKDKIIIMVMDINKVEDVKSMLHIWIKSKKLTGIEIQ